MTTQMTLADFMKSNPPKLNTVRIGKHQKQIFALKQEGYSLQQIADSLKEMHDISVTSNNLSRLILKMSIKDGDSKSEQSLAEMKTLCAIEQREQEIYRLATQEISKVTAPIISRTPHADRREAETAAATQRMLESNQAAIDSRIPVLTNSLISDSEIPVATISVKPKGAPPDIDFAAIEHALATGDDSGVKGLDLLSVLDTRERRLQKEEAAEKAAAKKARFLG